MTSSSGPELTTGWEHDLPAEDTLVRQAVSAHALWAEESAAAAGRATHRDHEICAAYVSDRGAFTNAAVCLRPVDEMESILGTLDSFYPRHVSYVLVSAWPTDDLRPRGLHLIGHPPLMLRLPAPGPPTAGLPPVREVSDAQGLSASERVIREGYPMPDLEEGFFSEALLGGSARFWVAYDDETPVAAGGAYVGVGINLVASVATLPSARGRGFGSAVTWAATLAEPSWPAVLLASDDGRPVYERMGFRAVERWTLWLRPGSS